MKRTLAPILLLTLLFPSLAMGQSLNDWVGKGKGLFCETTGLACPESVEMKVLVKIDGLYYKKFTDIPFTGTVTGQEQGYLKKGKWDGPWTRYYNNGKLETKAAYKEGKKRGIWIKYDGNGQIEFKRTYEYGNWASYYKNGQLRFIGPYKGDERNGPWVYYHSNGRLSGKGNYKDGYTHGLQLSYHSNGQLWGKGAYRRGKRYGPWVIYWNNGQLSFKGNYKYDKEDGPWVGYHKDGTVDDDNSGFFKNGVKVVKLARHTGKITKTKRRGRRIYLMYRDKEVKAKVSGSRTKVTLNGRRVRRSAVKVGMTSTFVYSRAGATAKQIICKN
jgi:antitoxin component YwqK of YwqJK toxin-antitoxin module